MFKFLKVVYATVKQILIVLLLCLSAYIIGNALQLEADYTEKYENAYNQMIREHDQNIAFGEMLRSQQAWVRSSDRIGLAFMDERSKRRYFENQLQAQLYEQYTFFNMLDKLYPGAIEAVYKQLEPPPAPGFPDVDENLDFLDFQLTPEA